MSAQADTSAHEDARLASALQSVLLVADQPVTARALTRLLDIDSKTLDRVIDYLRADEAGRGVRLQVHDSRMQLVTAPENADIVRRFLELPQQPKLSRPALETLAIIAYRQPVTRGEIEDVRGVNIDRLIVNLTARGWIEEAGRRDAPGRPIEYQTTNGFLELFGILSLDELAPLEPNGVDAGASLSVLGLESPDGEDPSTPTQIRLDQSAVDTSS